MGACLTNCVAYDHAILEGLDRAIFMGFFVCGLIDLVEFTV